MKMYVHNMSLKYCFGAVVYQNNDLSLDSQVSFIDILRNRLISNILLIYRIGKLQDRSLL